MPQLNVNLIKDVFRRKGWTQEAAADKVGISREQFGKHFRSDKDYISVNGKTAEGYAKAFGCEIEDLGKPPKPKDERPEGFQILRLPLQDSEAIALQLAFHRYGVPQDAILRCLVTCFFVAAELSLKKRGERLSRIKDAVLRAEAEQISMYGSHIRTEDVWEEISEEEASLKSNDLLGQLLPEDYLSENSDESFGVFGKFLAETLNELAPELFPSRNFDATWLCQPKIEEITDGDLLAWFALTRQDVPLADVLKQPPEKRAGFLRENCSPATHTEYVKYQELMASVARERADLPLQLHDDEEQADE